MGRLIRQLFAILIAAALIGAPVTAAIAMSRGVVVTSAPDDQLSSDQAPAPCKQMTPCCADMLGCGLNAALPTEIVALAHKPTWTPAVYQIAADMHEGSSVKPDLGPPITI